MWSCCKLSVGGSKLAPDAPDSQYYIEQIYAPPSAKGDFSLTEVQKSDAKKSKTPTTAQQQQHSLPPSGANAASASGAAAGAGAAGTSGGKPPKTKVAKYRARFDPRVTARYDIKALIGKGSFSRVVRVENRSTKQPYAIKMIEKREGRAVFETELSVLRRARHENIIQLIEVFESQDRVYMVLELATGGELFDRIVAKGTFTERDATRVVQMALDGLKHLHALGITHRDLKPENLLYYHPGNDSKIMITDFGLSATRKPGEDGLMTTTCGTPEYIAPEILARKPYSCAVDLWAMGVISFILLSGTMPFDDENRTRLYRHIMKVDYSYSGEHWKDVSQLAKDFIDRLLTVDPSQRLTSSQALRHPWIRTNAATSSQKNLHRSISQNLLKRQSSRAQSNRSAKSTRSNKSNRSAVSLRSQHQRVLPEELDELVQRDPDFADYARNFPQTFFPLDTTQPGNYHHPHHQYPASASATAHPLHNHQHHPLQHQPQLETALNSSAADAAAATSASDAASVIAAVSAAAAPIAITSQLGNTFSGFGDGAS